MNRRAPMPDYAGEIAIEQCLWWAEHGYTPRQALSALGIPTPLYRVPDWPEVQVATAIAWRRLTEG